MSDPDDKGTVRLIERSSIRCLSSPLAESASNARIADPGFAPSPSLACSPAARAKLRNPIPVWEASTRKKKTALVPTTAAPMALARIALLTLALAATPAVAQHVHGNARLDVAVDEGQLILMLEMPAEVLVGFERAPRTDKERAAIARARQTLEASSDLFLPSAEASCSAQAARVESPLFDPGAKLGHHVDVTATHVFACAHPDRLRAIATSLFERFPRLKRVDVQVASGTGQKAARLTPRQATLSLR
jgi:hypothetical protein